MPIPMSYSNTPASSTWREVEENEFNLNVPRYVDTFEPEPRMDVNEVLRALGNAKKKAEDAEATLLTLLRDVGYAVEK